MQDEINEKTVALYIKTGKLTAEVLQKAIKKLLSQAKKELDKQGGLSVPQRVKLHFVRFHKLPQLPYVKWRKPRTAGNEDRASCLSRR